MARIVWRATHPLVFAVRRRTVANVDSMGLDVRAWQRRVRVRQLVLSCSLLQHPVQQLSLFAAVDRSRERNRQISEACDAIRTRCGAAAIYRGSQGPLIAGAQLSP